MNTSASCVIVGAGIAGLLAARKLTESGHNVIVLERASHVGGRMRTVLMGDGVFDDGCQFFAAHEDAFRGLVEEWRTLHLAREWGSGFGSADGRLHADGQPRYCGSNGMINIPRWLAQGLDVRLDARVNAIAAENGGWRIETPAGAFTAASVILTAPAPQSLALLEAGDTPVPASIREQLDSIDYDPCFAVLALLDGPSRIPEPGGLRMPSEHIAWIADNHAKGISPGGYGVTILASAHFSRNYLDTDDDMVSTLLLGTAEEWFGADVLDSRLCRWDYSQPVRVLPERCLALDSPAPLVFAGDAFGGLRVEGAALSGLAAAERVEHLAI